ncbi:MAG: PEGA domain-containing protein [Lachnospira sp.]|nr:PEGA domain-containing protein [Lachnospira sp.]
MNRRNIQKVLALFLTVVMTLTMTVGMAGCGKKKGGTLIPGSSITPAPSKSVTEKATNNANEIALTGVLTYLNTSDLKMHFIDITSGTEYEVRYTGGSDIQSAYGKIKAASTMKVGEIYDVTCDKTGKAIKIYGSKNAWEKTGITGLTFDESSRKITIGATDYSYDSYAVIMSAAEKISIAQIVSQDEVTLRGIDNKVYSINVDNGHGYIELTGIDSFVDGYLKIGKSLVMGVGKNMLVTAPVGTYTVELQKGSLLGTKTVSVKKDEQTSVDFSECTTEAVKMGAVQFSITPENAIMSIDGKQIDYSEPVSLAYGNHRLVLQANYYEMYTATISVGSDFSTLVIDMTPTSSSTTKSSSTTATTKASGSSSTSGATSSNPTAAGASTSTNLTAGYSVKVSTPEGATLYVDGVSVGTIPCSFDKSSGTKTVTLSKDGYETVSYSISISNTTGDASYAFPDLVQK